MIEDTRWTHEQLKGLLERGPIEELEKLIADPGRLHRQKIAHGYAIDALRTIAEFDVLPEEIRDLVLHVLALHAIASDPSLGIIPIGEEETAL
ncbi:MAG: hypothetical protein M3Y76_01290 [Chloroflexota bacterium]|nr:hypothetical protein [Chloroflexota bacterium]